MHPSRQFHNSIMASLSYWREITKEIGDHGIKQLDKERQNLFRAVEFGLALPQAWRMTVDIALQTIPLINRRLYRREWIPVLEDLLKQYPEGNPRMKFNLLIQLGRLQRLELQRDQAVKTLEGAEDLAKQMGDQHALAQAYYQIGRAHSDARRYQKADSYIKSALDILDELKDVDLALLAWVLNARGKISQINGDFELAHEYYTRSISNWRKIPDETGLARTLMDLATNYRYSGDLDQAIAQYKQAEQIFSSSANELDKTLVAINLGATYYDKGEWVLAEETFRKAYSTYLRKSGELRMQAILTVNLGNVLLKVGRLAEAEAYLRQAIVMWEEIDDDLNLANCIGTLGEVLSAKGDYRAAITLFIEALSGLDKYSTHPFARQIRETFEVEKRNAEAMLRR